ncbi:MAG: FecR family protein [Elusimicrobiota bacterium]|jgi:hypothetical protein
MGHRIFLTASVLFLASAVDAQLVRIGAAGAVRGKVEALAPGQKVGRVLGSGKEVYLHDAVTTDADGRMQILLLDETVFTIGPNSSLVLDEFVYDPKVGEGKMTARVTKGVFRFVTGKIARENPEKMKVKLPVGVIGIRGTMVAAKIFSPTKVTTLLEGPGPRNNAGERPGAMIVSAGGQDSMATRPNAAIDVTPLGPSAPYLAPPSLVAEVSGDLAPKSDEPASTGSGGGGTAAASGNSATEDSGQGTAAALADLTSTESFADASEETGTLVENASQTTQLDDFKSGWFTSWDALAGTSLPNGYYSTSGSAQCAGDSCGVGNTATYSAQVDVSFSAKKITAVSFTVNWPVGSDSASLQSQIPFGTGSGQAQLMGLTGYLTNSVFNQTILTFLSENGVHGAKLEIDLHANGTGGEQISGCTANQIGSWTAP